MTRGGDTGRAENKICDPDRAVEFGYVICFIYFFAVNREYEGGICFCVCVCVFIFKSVGMDMIVIALVECWGNKFVYMLGFKKCLKIISSLKSLWL